MSLRSVIISALLASVLAAYASTDSLANASEQQLLYSDSIATTGKQPVSALTNDTSEVRVKKNTIFRRIGRAFTKVFKDFNDPDTNYIVPQKYNYTFMVQNTNTYEIYKIKSKSGQSITFAPRPTVKIGPYIGWRWIFLGYTIDVGHMNEGHNKKQFDLSLYSSMLGIDLYYRKAGNNYRIRRADVGSSEVNKALKDMEFSGLNVNIKGFDLYYIFNHKRFSYPAAFSQSTCQKRSCGSPLIGIGYQSHHITLDHESLQERMNQHLDNRFENFELKLDSGLMFNKIKYTSYSLSGGYAYNWVFAKNWLFSASLSVGIGYKKSDGNLRKDDSFFLKDFNFDDFNFDGIGRFGIVYNNMKWYAGASTILHSYSYNKSQFSTTNVFGSLNIYVGFNFGRKR